MLVDTHAHLWWESYRHDLDNVISRAQKGGVGKIIVPGTDLRSSRKAIELAKKYPGIIYAAVGIHPEETINKELAVTQDSTTFNAEILKLRQLVQENREFIVAIGEIGTDANTQELREQMTQQMNLFREQCEIALENELPVIVHTRNSIVETFRVLDSLEQTPRGQFHCFSYDEEVAQEILKRNFYLSFCGNISWSKRLQKICPSIPDERLLLETDSPLMLPRDSKGNPHQVVGGIAARNEPINVIILTEIQANLRGVSVEELGLKTSYNASKLFGII